MARMIRKPVRVVAERQPRPSLSLLVLHRNILLGMMALLCAMTGIFVLSAMVPSYLVDYRHLSTTQLGLVTSAIGLGGFLGQIGLSGLSDRLGRRPVTIIGFIGGAAGLLAFVNVATDPLTLFVLLFVCTFFCFGLLGLITGPIAVEAAPPGLVSSTAGLIIGGGVAPAIAGQIAQTYGIQNVFYLALGGLLLGVVFAVMLRETAPRRKGQGVVRSTLARDALDPLKAEP